jgi:hypothetical protein
VHRRAASVRRQIWRRDRHGAARAQPIDPSVYAYDAADSVLPVIGSGTAADN